MSDALAEGSIHIRYLGVNETEALSLPCSREMLATELAADWHPTFAVSPLAFVGWPLELLEEKDFPDAKHLCVKTVLARSDRQWKGFASWMLGVAGARRAIKHMKYRWIAPASAFYAERVNEVDSDWTNEFPACNMKLSRDPQSPAKLRPDYLALKKGVNGGYLIASVEAKGTDNAIMNESWADCPPDWAQQVRNIKLRKDGDLLKIHRYAVVGTRVNPSGKSARIRQLGIRVWNRNDESPRFENEPLNVLPIVYANLFGVYRNLGQFAVCRALSVSLRRNFGSENLQQSFDFEEESGLELNRELSEELPNRQKIVIRVADALATLTKLLIYSATASEAQRALVEAELKLDKWESESLDTRLSPRIARLSCGLEVEFL